MSATDLEFVHLEFIEASSHAHGSWTEKLQSMLVVSPVTRCAGFFDVGRFLLRVSRPSFHQQ
jgi:hypothetical protein